MNKEETKEIKKKASKVVKKISKKIKEHEEAHEADTKKYQLPKKLKGFIQTGLIYIGDPGYLAGTNNILPGDENPFREWDKFTESIEGQDAVLPFDEFGLEGKGVVVQSNYLSGRFEVEKEFDENGKLKSVKVVFFD